MADYSRKVDMGQLREITRKVLAYRVKPTPAEPPLPNTTTALLLAEDRKSKKRRRSGCIWAVHSVPWLFRMRFRTLIFAGKTADL